MPDELVRKAPKLKPSKRWRPKKWIPIYDQMVAMHCVGESNKAIAERFDYTPQQVCNILGSEQAKIIKELVHRKVLSELEDTGDRLKKIELAAIKNIERVISDEGMLESKPLAIFDRSMDILKGIGKLRGADTPVNQTNIFNIPAEHSAALASGIEKANEAMMLHGNVEVRTLPAGKKDEKHSGSAS
jgi:hypothetical protein